MFETKTLRPNYDYLAPDGSEIRLLLEIKGGHLAHCTLAEGRTSVAHRHKTVDEIWYFLSGKGEVWRKEEKKEETIPVAAGVCLSIPTGTRFQFRNTGNELLNFVIVTIPRWPGPQEAEMVEGPWKHTIF